MSLTETVLLYSTLAAATSALGAVPAALVPRLPRAVLGWANAIAAGLMLGAAHVLAVEGVARSPVLGALGAALGAGFVWTAHAVSGHPAGDVPTSREGSLVRASLHSAAEGVAIGAALLVSAPLGLFVAAAIAAHNVPEAMALTESLRKSGVRWRESSMLAVLANASQVVLSIATVLLAARSELSLAVALGVVAGAHVYLVLVDLLPESYEQAGHETIAVVTSVALGGIVLIEATLRAAGR